MNILTREDNNIEDLRSRYPGGLHFVVGDTHGEAQTLVALFEKIRFDPEKDYAYFVGDYNAGSHVRMLLEYISQYYSGDYTKPGCHLIRGNHERELWPEYPLENLPDIMVLRGKQLNYYLVHAGMVTKAFDLINRDMAEHPQEKVFAYRLDESVAGYDAPLRKIIWSRRGLYSQRSKWHVWPSEESLRQNRACIIHGHTPYCFLMREWSGYGDRNLFWKNQHIWFSEDLQSFNVDANVKGHYQNGEGERGLACVCLEVLEETASRHGGHLSVEGIQKEENGVFAAPYLYNTAGNFDGDIKRITDAKLPMKTITLGEDGEPRIVQPGDQEERY